MSARRTSTGDAPLLAWGEALRAARERRRRRIKAAVAIAAGSAALGLTIVCPPAPRLVWNASASAPVGLYAVRPKARIEPGGVVLARLPMSWRRLAARRRYIPAKVPLIKRVAAGPGDEVCALGNSIFINGAPAAQRLRIDAQGRPMPRWQGCRTLRAGQWFLLMRERPGSFDGRYFGVTSGSDIIGPVRLLWRR
ncbi:chromosome segregation protein ParM [Novosphingobium endophyticum]|uniref:Chromosome segregation protein ParM n=1 Tax=Novosphingobium endophyticum TaxID=1955250 RepID=A0A916TTH9_9SPHN|nr:S26 family signal peptidase [Novosphingobium endophyticum]GGC04909.1 chromosome segregation protein ParM [Novosphingobium endophyticum]